MPLVQSPRHIGKGARSAFHPQENFVKAWLRNLFGSDNGDDVCIAKIMAVVAFFSFLAYAGVGLHKGQFDQSAFASGIMQVLLGAGGVIAGKNLSTRKDA